MLGWIKEYKRKKLLKSCTSREIQTDFINLGDISSLGFVFALTSQESVKDLMDIYKFLKAKGIPFKGVAVEIRKNVFSREAVQKGEKPQLVLPDELAQAIWIKVIPYEKLSWLGAVEEQELKDFFASQTDIFISFNSTGNFTLDHIFASCVESPVRIGMDNNPIMPYSMVVEGKDKTILAPMEYLQQIFHYLEVIKTK